MATENLRTQDVVARVAGINLKSVVRVLTALELVARFDGETELADRLDRVLEKGAWNGGEPAALEDKPSDEAVTACATVFDALIDMKGWNRVRALQRLEGCPYYGRAVTDEEYQQQGIKREPTTTKQDAEAED